MVPPKAFTNLTCLCWMHLRQPHWPKCQRSHSGPCAGTCTPSLSSCTTCPRPARTSGAACMLSLLLHRKLLLQMVAHRPCALVQEPAGRHGHQVQAPCGGERHPGQPRAGGAQICAAYRHGCATHRGGGPALAGHAPVRPDRCMQIHGRCLVLNLR